MSTANFIQLLLSGLTMGALYALTAKGLFITHLATSRMNFGQGEFLMIAAYLSMALLLAGVPAQLERLPGVDEEKGSGRGGVWRGGAGF